MQTIVTLQIRRPPLKYVRQWYDEGLKYTRLIGDIYEFHLPLESDDYCKILKQIQRGDVQLEEKCERIVLTRKELDEHPFFEIKDEHLLVFPEEYNSILPGCPHCGFGKRFPDKLRLPIGQLKKKRLSIISMASASEQIMLIPAFYQKLFDGCSGISFFPVEPISPSRDGIAFSRMKVTSILPPLSGRTRFRPNGQAICRECHQPGWTLYENLFYNDSVKSLMEDFNLTAESIGGMPFHWIIVSQKVRQIMLSNKLLSGSCFSPVFFVSQDEETENPVWQDSPNFETSPSTPMSAKWKRFLEKAEDLPARILMHCDSKLVRLENAIIAGLEDGTLHPTDVASILASDKCLKPDDARLKELLLACHSGRYQPTLRLEITLQSAHKKTFAEIKKRVAEAGLSIPDRRS